MMNTLFPIESPYPKGFPYIPAFINEQEEQQLLHLIVTRVLATYYQCCSTRKIFHYIAHTKSIMEEGFEIPVTYKGEEIMFPAHLQQRGYTHRFIVDVYGQEVFFEPDEERNYRAIIDPEKINKDIDMHLLKVIAAAIETIVK